jgi:hypothetical protein
MFLNELLVSREPALQRIRESGNDQASFVETRLHIAARHVGAARLGASLFDTPEVLATVAGGATVQTAGLLSVFGSGQTSIDLSATALLRWHGFLPDGAREHDFGNLKNRVANGTVRLTEAEKDWFDEIAETDIGRELVAFRDTIIHKVLSQSATVRPGAGRPSYALSTSTAIPGTEEAIDTLQRHTAFVEDRWRQIVDAIAGSLDEPADLDDSEEERLERLNHVLGAIDYEFKMLVVSAQLLGLTQPIPTRDPGSDPLPWMSWAHNAHIEAHLVHARNLLEFFYLRKQPIRARDFVEGEWRTLRPEFAHTFQLQHARPDGEPAAPKDLWSVISTKLSHVVPERSADVKWEISRLTSGFLHVAAVFVDNLRPEFASLVDTSWFEGGPTVSGPETGSTSSNV